MNKLFFPLLLLMMISSASAKPKRFMICLGKEEALIHKENIGGALYKLNQEMISSLVQLRDSIYMKKDHVEDVCKANYPSIKLLEALIKEDDVFFSIHNEKRTPKRLAIDRSTINELRANSATLFVNFLSQVQAGLGSPNCLQKNIPELSVFFEKMQYILEDVGPKRILETLKDPEKIFQKLQNLDVKKARC